MGGPDFTLINLQNTKDGGPDFTLINLQKMKDEVPDLKVSKGAKIRNRYNQVPHLTQNTNGKVTNSQ